MSQKDLLGVETVTMTTLVPFISECNPLASLTNIRSPIRGTETKIMGIIPELRLSFSSI